MRSDRVRLIVSLILLVAAIVAMLLPGGRQAKGLAKLFSRIKLGLDLSGGVRLEYKVDIEKGVENPAAVVDDVWTVLRNRLDSAGYTEAVVKKSFRENNSFIIIEIPDATDTTKAEKLVGSTGLLWFGQAIDERDYDPTVNPDDVNLALREGAQWYADKNGKKWYLIKKEINNRKDLVLVGPKVVEAVPTIDQKGVANYVVSFTLDRQFVELFKNITKELYVPEQVLNAGTTQYQLALKKRLAIVLDDKVQFVGFVVSPIEDGRGQIRGNFTFEEAKELAAILRSGALPARLEKISASLISPTLGKDALEQSLRAGIIGGILVMAYILIFYGVMGIVAVIGIFYALAIIFGFLAGTGAILTLPGIAGIIFTIGTLVDGNIIIYERIKEEMRAGKTPKAAIEIAFSRSFWTLFDANLTTIIAALFLYYFGTGTIKGFAVTTIVGIFAAMFMNLVFSKFLLDAMSGAIRVRKAGGAQ
ncbi:protein-export membrane protein, SecD/SecF family [Fervidobacterium pennivorans DSM 9078]|jgi:preprotein translocase subunit SecD|uniref:Protein translocase subunit SecD n=1 Tax=Fervidobacterium pennivorans (strain DSM 9078 / Ven5) TaxID=771875 RepID=H9UE72_FERPD|nr:protein translocase subunit SecD [Fervidobacterium pennivorans]AFG35815.1 protein-export membrane protein, SecD/SecF family [Fervidobacterium pennivorans DSM 9078]QIV78617.1 protein translocase subunit SecD [Fervidobacterium pennivorans subsp. keratinolyticus]